MKNVYVSSQVMSNYQFIGIIAKSVLMIVLGSFNVPFNNQLKGPFYAASVQSEPSASPHNQELFSRENLDRLARSRLAALAVLPSREF